MRIAIVARRGLARGLEAPVERMSGALRIFEIKWFE
jgi:hypothetical protein